MDNQSLMPFEGKGIRKVWQDDQWYFSVIDIIDVLTDTSNPSRYWQDLKRKSQKTEGQVYDFIVKLRLKAQDGKSYPSDCATIDGIFRIIMSIPSPKAEPLKLWLAEQGKRAIEEVENPELMTERQTEIYKAKGYSDEWIDRRIKSIDTRKRLTDEWKNRGIQEGQEYSLLTATIAKGTFGLTPKEHAQLKGLDKENLRDHMTPLELILTALSEEVTRTIAITDDAQGFHENHEAAVRGGQVGRKALLNVEEGTGRKVVSPENYMHLKGVEKNENLPPAAEDTD